MINQLTIKNFRCFKDFEMHDLGRVNLLVGKNNSGKSSVLEAVQILMSNDTRFAMTQIAKHRGEVFEVQETDSHIVIELDISRFYYEFNLNLGNEFKISAKPGNLILRAELRKNINQPSEHLISVSCSSQGRKSYNRDTFTLSKQGGITPENFVSLSQPGRYHIAKSIHVLPTVALTSQEVSLLYGQIEKKSERETIVESLQLIEPMIDDIILGTAIANSHRGGIFVWLKNQDKRIPIGTMGDGIWRILGIALSLAKAKDGILLIDEIDTGLHHTTMDKMWRMVTETAERLNVQVFATTHSRDCIESLAIVADEANNKSGSISLQRIEKDLPVAIAYAEDEIIIAAERGLEVR